MPLESQPSHIPTRLSALGVLTVLIGEGLGEGLGEARFVEPGVEVLEVGLDIFWEDLFG